MELPTSTNFNRDLDHKISLALGRHSKHHMSNIDTTPNSTGLLFTRPGRRGFFTINNLDPRHQFETFEVFCDRIPLGRMTYHDICIKFGRW